MPITLKALLLRRRFEITAVASALSVLFVAELYCAYIIPGTNYSQTDGKTYQAAITIAMRFGGILNTTNFDPVQGFGSLLLPMNAWLNPAYWPFAAGDPRWALELSAAIALCCLALGCYVMARCFEAPLVPSIIAAQLVIVLAAPLVRVMGMFYQMLWLNPGLATIYGASLAALGVFASLHPGRVRSFIYAAGGVFGLLLYGICCDPFWIVISGLGLAGGFAVVLFFPWGLRQILFRAAVLGSSATLLAASGALVYVYTLSRYNARVWFPDLLYYTPAAARFLGSVSLIFPKTFTCYYAPCGVGWLLGLIFARGRPRLLVCAALGSLIFFISYAVAYELSARWTLPLPIYIEEPAMPLFTTAAVVGYWAALDAIARWVFRGLSRLGSKLAFAFGGRALPASSFRDRAPYLSSAAGLATLLAALVVPASAVIYVKSFAGTWPNFFVPFPDEPELLDYLDNAIALRPGAAYRGVASFPSADTTVYNLWMHGTPTVNEYSQTFAPQVLYMFSAFFRMPVRSGFTNGTAPGIGPDGSYDVLLKTLQALGVRYLVYADRFSAADQRGLPFAVFPRRPPIMEGGSPSPDPPGEWVAYELPNPNLGDYSPTRIVLARTGADIAAAVRDPDFDFQQQVVLTRDIATQLVPASDVKLSILRDGLHLKGHSDGTSIVVLPEQFSRCLAARDPGVRLVRADLLLTGVVFSGDIDTDISFRYGVFTPWCRLRDLRETRTLDLKIEPPR
jgi:hypothetical protein